MTNTIDNTGRADNARVGRRSLMATTAWAIPTGVIVTAAPALATSSNTDTPPDIGNPNIGLQGLLNIGKGCNGYGGERYRLVINANDISGTKPVYDENGQLVKYGFYVLGAGPDQKPSNARFTTYLPSSLGTFTWTNRNTASGWSNLVLDTAVAQYPGYTAYTATFNGTWVYSVVDGKSRWVASGSGPSWGANPPNLTHSGSASNYCRSGTMRVTALRRVTVAGKVLSFQRSIVL